MNLLDTFSLEGKIAVVTGGGGNYGKSIVSALAGAGAKVIMASRQLSELEAQASAYRAEGLDVHARRLDQGDEASIISLREELQQEFGGMDVLINNAVARPAAGVHADAADLDRSLHINGTGLILVTRSLGEILHDGGSIINIGSIMGLVGPEPGNYDGTDMSGWVPDYYFHKGGMANVTRFFASYYGPRGIRVNCVHAGGLASESHPEAFTRNYSARTCLGRLANQTDLQGIIIFLSSNASAYLTGTNIPVDGGYTCK